MRVKLDLQHNAFNSIYQGLTYLNKTALGEENYHDSKVDFDHDDQMTSYHKKGKEHFYLGDYYYKPPRYYNLKYSIQYLVNGIELLLLDIVKSKNPDAIFEASNKGKTINFWSALKKAMAIIPRLLTESQKQCLQECKVLRNKLEHFEIDSNYSELYRIACQLLSIINCIFQFHLGVFVTKFYSFDCWKEDINDKFTITINNALHNVKEKGYDFNRNLLIGKPDLSYCFYCNELSYSNSDDLCLFCLTEIDEKLKAIFVSPL